MLCYGDSNTYGYDPRSYLGGRYPYAVRWTGRLGSVYAVINAGQNGRTIPSRPAEYAEVIRLYRQSCPVDLFAVMLGTNDLLNFSEAEETADRLRRFWEAVLPGLENAKVLLIAPPPLRPGEWTAKPSVIEQSIRYAALCGVIARDFGFTFADAGAWEIDLTFDGVHFSAEGHRAFANGLLQICRTC